MLTHLWLLLQKPVKQWNSERVARWLASIGKAAYTQKFKGVTGQVFPHSFLCFSLVSLQAVTLPQIVCPPDTQAIHSETQYLQTCTTYVLFLEERYYLELSPAPRFQLLE